MLDSLIVIFMKHCEIESNIVRCPDPEYAKKMIDVIDTIWVIGDSIGGVVTCIVRNCPRVRTPTFGRLLCFMHSFNIFMSILFEDQCET